MGYKRIELPYDYNFLEPYIDTQTVKLHYDVHHKGYEQKLNAALKKSNEEKHITNKFPTVEELMKNYQKIKDRDLKIAIREFGGGLINHNFLWKEFSKENNKIQNGNLLESINKKWGSFEKFQEDFQNEVLSLFGSGWVWLAKRKNNDLKIIKTFNQDNPWFLNFKPIIGIDLWEHAYYLKHNANRKEYLEDFWKIIDWKKAEDRFNEN